ncbi:ABC transporter ATP-binding protein [soil metagenome]
MINFKQVSFSYNPKNKLFKDLSLSLGAGHIYGLLGKNGAGKSSLLRLMAGLLFPESGSIQLNEWIPGKRQPGFLQQTFFIPEEIDLPAITINQYYTNLAPFYPHFNKEQFNYYLNEFDVLPEQNLTSMSFGQKKKVMISFGLATNTKFLIMDEPTNGLDIPSKSQFRKLVASVLDENRLVLISTHQVRDLDNLIDSVIILEESNLLLHHHLDFISEKLRFGTLLRSQEDNRVLYAEPSLGGYNVVMENSEKEDSKVDLEKLFNAVINNPDRIKNLFEKTL